MEFQKFGKIEGVAFSHDQTSAYIDFEKLDYAIFDHRALNGTNLGGKELCVDFQRSRVLLGSSLSRDVVLLFSYLY